MFLNDYVTALQGLLAATPFITATALSYEERPPSAGLIKGTLVFTDGSQLDFKEFLLTQPTLHVIKYGYHYRMGNRLVFRYDNANDPAARHLPLGQRRQRLPDLVGLAQGAQALEDHQSAGQILAGLRDVALLLVQPTIARIGQR